MAFNKDYRFIVLNRGEKDGVEAGLTYIITLQGDNIGRVKPDRIYESMSVFDILEGRVDLKEGMEIELFRE